MWLVLSPRHFSEDPPKIKSPDVSHLIPSVRPVVNEFTIRRSSIFLCRADYSLLHRNRTAGSTRVRVPSGTRDISLFQTVHICSGGSFCLLFSSLFVDVKLPTRESDHSPVAYRGGGGVNPPPRNSEDIGGALHRMSRKNRCLDFLL